MGVRVMTSLQFVLGRASRDHQGAMVDRLAKQMQERPRDRFFYLVPNHVKFTSEVAVLKRLREHAGMRGNYAQSRVQVLSFSRLAWYLCADQPAYQKPRLSAVGMTMVVAKVLQELRETDGEALRMFRGESDRQGFVQELTRQLVELQTARVTPADLAADRADSVVARVLRQNPHAQVFKEKMAVLARVYQQFLAVTATQATTGDLYLMLARALQEGDFTDSHFYFDHYTGHFSAQEQEVVAAVMENAADVTMSLVLDRDYPAGQLPSPNNLYYQAARQYQDLRRLAAKFGVAVPAPQLLGKEALRVSPALTAVEDWMAADARFTTPERAAPETGNQVQFLTAPSRVAELHQVAAKIRRLVATKGYHFHDFLVLTRHLAGYETMLVPVFKAHQVPVFNDTQRPMAKSALADWLTALFKVGQDYYQAADVFTLLKTGLLVPPVPEELSGLGTDAAGIWRDAVNQAENYCLRFGKGGRAWFSPRPWSLTPGKPGRRPVAQVMRERQINWVKDFVKLTLRPFWEQLSKQTSGRGLATCLYQFMTTAGVDDQIFSWARAARDAGDLTRMQDLQQEWQAFCSLLDEYVALLGDQVADPAAPEELVNSFATLLTAGFGAARYSQIPSTLDQVVVSETGMAQDQHRRVVFMIGATADVMPEVQATSGLLTDPDRALLQQGLGPDQFLAPTGTAQINNEPFVHYLGMLSATDTLIMTAPTMASDESELTLSPYLIGLARYFGAWDPASDWLRRDVPRAPHPGASPAAVIPFLSTPAATVGNLIQVERAQRDGAGPLGSAWQQVAAGITTADRDGRLQTTAALVLNDLRSGRFFKNETTALPPSLAAVLYTRDRKGRVTNQLQASISQLETYYQNPYEYFLKYGLRLKKREELTITSAKSGTFFHDSLAFFIQGVLASGRDLAEYATDPAARDALINQAIDRALSQQEDVRELAANQRPVALQLNAMTRIVQTMATTLVDQAQYTTARPLAVEQAFGAAQLANEGATTTLPPLTYSLTGPGLATGARVALRGRIDRLDQVRVGDQDYQLVVDYKSSDHQFDLVDAYTGRTLQMLAYLNALAVAHPTHPLAGALYLRLYQPTLRPTQDPQAAALAAHHYKGLLINGDQVLTALDAGLARGKAALMDLSKRRGKAAPLKVSADDAVQAKVGSNLVTEAELAALRERNAALIKQAAVAILQGHDELAPFRRQNGQQTSDGLQFSDYLDIYCFDRILDDYREVTMTADQVAAELTAAQNEQKGSAHDL